MARELHSIHTMSNEAKRLISQIKPRQITVQFPRLPQSDELDAKIDQLLARLASKESR
jgi:hypothetical protein